MYVPLCTHLHYRGMHSPLQPDVVHFLLRSGAFVNEPNSEGNTALHYACVSELPHRNYAETLRQLLNSGADINARNDRGDTPLHLAAE